jgi:hypothetical protein
MMTMKKRDFTKNALAPALLCLALQALWAAPSYAGWQLAVTFTTTSPGGDLRFDPQHVEAVWVEDARGAFVKTIGRWGVVEQTQLTQWMAADGTYLDGWTGATPKAYGQDTATWDLKDRTGVEVPDGIYYIRFELTNHNATQNQFRRTTVAFFKDGVPKSQFLGSQGGFLNITLDYTFTPTVAPQVTGKPAAYITGHSARLLGQVVDTGGEDPNVYLYWGDLDGGTNPQRWAHVVDLGPRGLGTVRVDLADLDAATEYCYRLYAVNSAGEAWADRTESFWTDGESGYYTGYRVQSGRTRVESTRTDIDILPVNDTSRAFVLFSYGTGWQPDVENANIVMARGSLLDKDTIRIERTAAANATWVGWQVIECLGGEFQAYRGSGSLGNDQILDDAPLNGTPARPGRRTTGPPAPEVRVDPTRCLAYVTADSSAGDRTYYHEALLTAYVNTNTTVRIERAAAGHSTIDYNWVVVEFDPNAVASVQHGSLSFTGPTDAAPASRKIVPVQRNSSLLIYQSRSTVNGLSYAAIAGRLVSNNTVEFYQYTGSTGTRYVEYHVVDFGPGARAQRGKVDFSDEAGWAVADCPLTPPVDTSRAMYFHGQTCNGTGDFYPRPFSTAEFTADDNLRIERQCPGQPSHLEWQVLELPPATFFTLEPNIALAPASLAFGATPLGSHADLTLEIRNTGGADLHVDSLEFTGLSRSAYRLVSPPPLPFTVPAWTGKEVVTVRFTPAAVQSYDYAKLTVGSDDPDEPVTEITLTGRGQPALQAAGAATAEERKR